MTVATTPANLFAVGDILVSSWGYDQTNIDFYQVVKVTKATIGIRVIRSTVTETGYMSGQSEPRPGVFDSDELLTKRPNKFGYVRMNSFSGAVKWDGKPRYVSWYA